jgi:NTP pyrophosphatase (non-canonical NTP hydrolase)
MTPNEYQNEVMRTAPTDPDLKPALSNVTSQLLHAHLGITTELGEFASPLKKRLMYGQTLDITNMVEECGDMLWYISLALNALGVDLETCMNDNINKLKIRYPEKFTYELAKERLDKHEE